MDIETALCRCLWTYAVYALVIYTRAAAERRGGTVEQVARDIAERHQLGDLDGNPARSSSR